jgi:hypothetical protein
MIMSRYSTGRCERTGLLLLPIAAFVVMGSTVQAADGSGDFASAVRATKPIIDTRLRYETVDQDLLPEDAEALTFRARFGFETGKFLQTSLLAEAELLTPLEEHYNDTINGKTRYPTVADAENYELNRLQLQNSSLPGTTVTLGRQRILLDDQRFVGNVGWRQNEQTFDALRVVNKSIKHLTIDATYVDQINRVFGEDSPQGRYHGDTYLANVSYQFPVGKLTGFGYFVDIDPIAAVPAAVRDSSQTLGLRFAGEHPFGNAKLAYALSYATQKDYKANPLDYDADYYLAELTGTYAQFSLGAGYEVLEGDGVKGFATPLATLHKFQGWVDKFPATPANGIEDKYVMAGATFKSVSALDLLSLQFVYHWYEAEHIDADYGKEANVQLVAKMKRLTATVKYGDYQADALFTDTSKFWFQLEYAW